MPVMTHASLFSGIGGFDLGFEFADIETIAQCEIDPYARTVLAHHFPEVTCYHDITTLDGRDLRGVDIISGGFPCQDLSVAGKRAGLSGARSGLFFQLARVVEEARPRLLVWENVPGLLSSSAGNAMRTVCGELASIGYFGAWRVLDSQFHGVPQRRRRVIGAFAPRGAGGWARGAAVLLEPEGGGWNPAASGEEGEGATDGVSPSLKGGGNCRHTADHEAYVPEVNYACTARDAKGISQREGVTTLVVNCDATPKTSENVAMTLRPDGEGRGSSGGKQYVCFQQNQRDEVRLIGGNGEVAGALPSQPGMKQQNYVHYDRTCQNNRILSPDGVAQPHRANASGGSDLVQAQGVRRLTPLECERLQGFPDAWTDVDGMSDTQRYRQLGNAVSVPVAYWIGLRAKMALESECA